MSININEMIKERLEKADDKNPIKISYENKFRYYNDFLEMLDTLYKSLDYDEMKDLLDNKIRLASKYNEAQYLQNVSEINVLYYILRKYNNRFVYEPKYNGNKNPECCFEHNGKIINIEVKCPDLTKRIESERHNTLKICMPERIPEYKTIVNEVKEILKPNICNNYIDVEEQSRLDNKLKDYVTGASDKFPISDDTNFNILAVSLDAVSDLDEWYSYIFGNEGVFTNNSFVPAERYKNLDAILLTTSMCGHKRYSKFTENVWLLEETINLLFLDPKKQKTETGKFYFDDVITLFGDLTVSFLEFQLDLDKKSQSDWEKVKNNPDLQQAKWNEQKLISVMMISEFLNKLKEEN
ncbi:hypothetical protein [Clostridium cellulovorans]|uniref:Uncharacterized protein n=1 Tax=Clostridium cellulovorans (strain ATCC 35296 / DSM 3052 / OCM 3 / 743B) TaxID=573061 RepID=D9SQ13_CLOC7|nr:hypothetical protein [Clostridium cellulovorans]ADL52149.1 hypothetical protein Clocel_2436 [Clostridium cellulovorans 743B]